ncbi:MAG: SDR family NAD(P)-dependent oxidoreductase [Candidatus Dormibacteraeota bacterium]|nr:SDR family NAD(P)-dependent oxidoreductase [Candidatus Dormibacteraeota bacterium]
MAFSSPASSFRQGCRRVAICARDLDQLGRAHELLSTEGVQVVALPCDVSDQQQVEHLIQQVEERLGAVDLLVNNAGVIHVGPQAALTEADYREALDIMFWGVLRPTLAVLPGMRRRHAGHIVNITSIGGKISVPHLSAYSTAKFAAAGFSEGLHAELAHEGIAVTTVVPGLMRTGSHLNAKFKADADYPLFALGASLPGISMDAERAARQIVAAARRGAAEVILSLPAKMAVRVNGVAPAAVSRAFALVARVLPAAPAQASPASSGRELEQRKPNAALHLATALSRNAVTASTKSSPSSAGDLALE